MKKFTIGCATFLDRIVLISKTKPEWQKGLLNFVGGKLELTDNNNWAYCQAREFYEETGIFTEPKDWQHMGVMFRRDDFECHVFCAHNNNFANVYTKTEEIVEIVSIKDFLNSSSLPLMPNLRTFYHYSISNDFKTYNCQFTIEYPQGTTHDIK